MDIGPYWYDPLGRVFALSQGDIEAEALKVIRKDFAFGAKGRWDEDGRARRNLYEEHPACRSDRYLPRADNLHFYHAYHAMMIVAGRLLESVPTHRNPEYGEDDEFADWLSRHDLTRRERQWLWDRRDPEPLAKGAWVDRDKEHPDRRQVTNGDFEEALRTGDRLNLWGYWAEADTSREQSVHIYSALVPPDKSDALLRALGSAKDIHAYAIPSAGSDMEIDNSGFELKGWVFDPSRDGRLDGMDRWAGGISFPPPSPATFIVKRMRLDADLDIRIWKDHSEACVMESEVSGSFDEAKRHERSNPDRGSRLQVSASFVVSMLTELDREPASLKYKSSGTAAISPYESGEKDDDERIKRRAKLYLLGKDGKIRTV